MREARVAGGTYWEADPGHAAILEKAKARDELGRQIGRLGGPGSGSLAVALAADRDAAERAHREACAAAEGRLRAGIAGLVARAVAGDEPSRRELENLARAQPRAFPEGLANALQRAQLESVRRGAVDAGGRRGRGPAVPAGLIPHPVPPLPNDPGDDRCPERSQTSTRHSPTRR